MTMSKKAVAHENQLSFNELFEADDRTYEAICVAKDDRYELRYSQQMAYEIIRDSLYIMTAPRSNVEQRVDEILWFFSDKNQSDLCSFTSCCFFAKLDPEEIRMSVLHRWKHDLAEQDRLIQSKHYDAPSNMDFVESQRRGFQKYKKAFYHHYPNEAARKCA